ncbi:hypothetical protein [Kocuria sp. NPDC057446]
MDAEEVVGDQQKDADPGGEHPVRRLDETRPEQKDGGGAELEQAEEFQ